MPDFAVTLSHFSLHHIFFADLFRLLLTYISLSASLLSFIVPRLISGYCTTPCFDLSHSTIFYLTLNLPIFL